MKCITNYTAAVNTTGKVNYSLPLTINAQITKTELTATGFTCSVRLKATYKQLTSMPEMKKVETDSNKTGFLLQQYQIHQ